MEVVIANGVLVARGSDYHLSELVRRVAGSRWNRALEGFLIPFDIVSVWEVSQIEGIVWSEEARALAREVWEATRARWETLSTQSGNPKLSPLQRAGVAWLRSGNGLLADEMGSGKTVQVCQALEEEVSGAVLVVCPPTVTRVWREHLLEWTEIAPFVMQGTKPQRLKVWSQFQESEDRSALIVPWSSLRLHASLSPYGAIARSEAEAESKELNSKKWEVIVADEAHRAKNPHAKQTRALWSIEGARRWALTGTPIANHAGDLWSILRWLEPAVWTSRAAYVEKWCEQVWSPFGAPVITGLLPHRVEIFRQLLGHLIVGRPKSQIMGRDILKHHSTRYARLPPKQRRQYETLKADWLVELDKREEEGSELMVGNFLTLTTRLVQLASAPMGGGEDAPKMVGPSPKVSALLEILGDTDAPVVVYSASRQLVDLAEKALKKAKVSYARATGAESVETRQEAVALFQTGAVRVFLATSGAAGEGIDLTRAALLVHLSLPWSMIQLTQAEDRIHRWSQESDSVHIVDIVAEDTIDERIVEVLRHKKARLHQLRPSDLRH